MKTLFAAAMAAVAVYAVAPAAFAAEVVDFNSFAHDGDEPVIHGERLTYEGLRFTTTSKGGFGSWGAYAPQSGDRDGATLATFNDFVTLVISRDGGGLFNIASLDIGDAFNLGTPLEIGIHFFDGLEMTHRTYNLDDMAGLDRLTLGYNVEYLQISSRYAIQIDNVAWGEPVTSAVPEPASWALMITGFAGAGLAIRNRRRSGQAALAGV